MSYRTGPKIVTDGLVCCLDAADRNSYPGSGSTWIDLSGNGNNGTFGASTAAPAFSLDNGGCIVFAGDDEVIPNSSIRSSILNARPYCVSVWVYKSSSATGGYCVYDCDNTRFNLNYNTYVSNKWSFDFYDGTEVILSDNQNHDDQWVNFLLQHHQDGLMEFYSNGSLADSQASVGNIVPNGNIMRIGRAIQNYQKFVGKIANFIVYNDVLTLDQILQNYNATKGRFGL